MSFTFLSFVGLGVTCEFYHAGLPIKERKRVHHLFIRDEIQVCIFQYLVVCSSMDKQLPLLSRHVFLELLSTSLIDSNMMLLC